MALDYRAVQPDIKRAAFEYRLDWYQATVFKTDKTVRLRLR
jgi:hypothetical protein